MAALLKLFRRIRRCESGAEFVEMALAFPLLLLVVLGIVEFGLLFQRYNVITNAAREGARIGVLPDYAVPGDVVTRVDQYLAANALNVGSFSPTYAATHSLNVGGGKCIDVVEVVVFYHHQFTFVSGIASYFGSSFGSKTLTGRALMRSETSASTCSP
jgi:Flp pilus assembly protein TadG